MKECLKIKSGKDQKQVECLNGKYKIYGTGGVIGTTNSYLYNKESVGIGRKGTIDKPFYFDKPFWTVDTLFYSEINNYYMPKYIYYLFQTIPWKKYNTSTGVPSLTSTTIEAIEKSFPPLEEQRKIAEFLSLIDERIETQIKIINDLVLQKKCIISSLLKSVQDNEKIMLKDILFDYNIKTTINNEYPVLSSTASGMYLQSEYFNKEASSDNTIGYKIIPRGYCTYRSMSDTGLFTFNMQELVEKGIVSPAYPVFSANDDYINEFIILYLNNSSYIKKQILELKSGGTRFALPFSTLCTLKIPKLDKEKQLSLIKIITAFERKIENEEMILKSLHQQKYFLLNNMFI